jgi:hypothetical protein
MLEKVLLMKAAQGLSQHSSKGVRRFTSQHPD